MSHPYPPAAFLICVLAYGRGSAWMHDLARRRGLPLENVVDALSRRVARRHAGRAASYENN